MVKIGEIYKKEKSCVVNKVEYMMMHGEDNLHFRILVFFKKNKNYFAKPFCANRYDYYERD